MTETLENARCAPPEFGENMTGTRFGKLIVLAELPGVATGKRRIIFRVVECLCDCGVVKTFRLNNLKSGRTVSCGCWRKGHSVRLRLKHGHTSGHGSTPEYKSWAKIKERCFNPTCPAYRNYGGRGITLCDEWRDDFAAFLAYIGPRPGPGYTVDRIDNDGNYEPGNVRWATAKQQAANRRRNPHYRQLTAFGRQDSILGWSRYTGINSTTIGQRLAMGWSVDDALSRPVEQHRRLIE